MMGSFTHDLRARLERVTGQTEPWGDVNPLVIIGLTEAILDLGLTEEQMYHVIRSYGRQLAAQVHPDRQPDNVTPERQKQILGAFDVLDSRENFSRALVHFKTLRADDRRETKVLGQALSSLREQIRDFESQFESLRVGKSKLEEDKSEFLRLRAAEPDIVSELEDKIRNLRDVLDRTEAAHNSLKSQTSTWKWQFEATVRYLAYLSDGVSDQPLGIDAFKAKWVAVASLWPPGVPLNGSIRRGRVNATPISRAFIKRVLETCKTEANVDLVINAWRETEKRLGEPGRFEHKVRTLGLTIIELNNGHPSLALGYIGAATGGRVIGSIPPDKLQPERSHLVFKVPQPDVFQMMSPFIVSGGMLISIKKDESRKAAWSMECPAIHFSTKRVILAVG